MKAALDFRVECACGWVWQGNPDRDLLLAAEGELLYTSTAPTELLKNA